MKDLSCMTTKAPPGDKAQILSNAVVGYNSVEIQHPFSMAVPQSMNFVHAS
jgi:hypothetical protein